MHCKSLFRYGMNYSILSEAITLTGHRIIQESALCANRHMNKVIRNEIKLKSAKRVRKEMKKIEKENALLHW